MNHISGEGGPRTHGGECKAIEEKQPPFRGDVRVCTAVGDPALLCR